jgi:hypothetical protein
MSLSCPMESYGSALGATTVGSVCSFPNRFNIDTPLIPADVATVVLGLGTTADALLYDYESYTKEELITGHNRSMSRGYGKGNEVPIGAARPITLTLPAAAAQTVRYARDFPSEPL